IGEQLLGALGAVHAAGIIHRDVKPENVVVLRDGRIKLADFGVAWMENEATLTRTGGMLGSPAYMSPEQILARPLDYRSDQFSAAATLYQLLTDRLPFAGAGLMELAQNVVYHDPEPLPEAMPLALRQAIRQALAKAVDDRFATAAEFAEALTNPELTRVLEPPPPRVSPPAAVLPAPAQPQPPPRPPQDEYTVYDRTSRCARHPGRPAIAHCKACSQAVCVDCTRQDRSPYFCMVHTPITLFGVPLVRYEIALVLVLVIGLLLWLGPMGYEVLRR
ncbi:MAG: serine/threonine protein kinase, partial [Armatimonadetes bacterium]|nr:serine/threonine protein kinase [Armatimonadota bacterium]